jgi:hypothetical protein
MKTQFADWAHEIRSIKSLSHIEMFALEPAQIGPPEGPCAAVWDEIGPS